MPAGSDDGHSTSGASGSGIGGDQLFVQHQITRLDSLAGLAVRYNVTVSDIKRANSLLSDTAMFARDTLLIPTRPMPIGNECSAMAGMILTQYGQIAREHSRTRGAVAGGSFDSSAGGPRQGIAAIDQLRAHYGLTPHGSPRTASQGGGVEYAHSDDGGYRRRGEVEMQEMAGARPMERRPSLPDLTAYAGEKGGPAVDERLRRRRAQEGDDQGHIDLSAGPRGPRPSPGADTDAPSVCGPGRPPLLPSSLLPSTSRARGGQRAGGTAPPPGRRRETFFEKVKRAASQPALAGPPGPSFNTVAASAIASAQSQLPRSSALQQAVAALQGPKDGAKKE